MKDLSDTRLMWLKAWLFLLIGITSTTLLILEHPELKTALYVGLAIWAFCRAYYFAFYVVEHYVDGEFRYAGLLDFVVRRIRIRRKTPPETSARRPIGGG